MAMPISKFQSLTFRDFARKEKPIDFSEVVQHYIIVDYTFWGWDFTRSSF